MAPLRFTTAPPAAHLVAALLVLALRIPQQLAHAAALLRLRQQLQHGGLQKATGGVAARASARAV